MPRPRLPQRLRPVLRTSLGLAALGFCSSFFGAGVVFLVLLLQGVPEGAQGTEWIIAVVAAGYVLLSVLIGTTWAVFLQRRTVVWFVLGRTPTGDEARRALRLPLHLAKVSGTLWLGGIVVLGTLTAVFGTWFDAMGVSLAIALGGIATVGLNYLATEWVARPLLATALHSVPPGESLATTVLARLVVTWMLASGAPMIGVLILVLPPDLGGDPRYSLMTLSILGLLLGAAATFLLARSVAAPLHRLRDVLGEIARGRRDVAVGVDDASEIGMLQASVNDLTSGLREQERMRDLFGRHVGDEVARHALEHGASMSGDVRVVTALFVDVVDSTSLAAELAPDEVARKLNGLFSSVVDAVSTHGGLVNKFQGDAAMCIFGAPARHADPATSALAAARAIRDAVSASGELDLGIGVATGPAFAGQLGTSTRFEYTVIGDAVNEAARLTEHAKHADGRILASRAALDAACDAERDRWHPHETYQLRGRAEPTETWSTPPGDGASHTDPPARQAAARNPAAEATAEPDSGGPATEQAATRATDTAPAEHG
ncbi:adenylate cyclase [Prauserella aidingensis]|uniref:adenylate/guanylate cyclase domain-containing protein n=1 Tax=Prauserella aidingensis TaxID=387890 RepID=UPI0020A4E56A|nr:adenylate/guanylate cyclase domain-containing protein [Prauserella aidingensis]MCP2256196.1 adenylate cyclase [Prauserella aidingensis]